MCDYEKRMIEAVKFIKLPSFYYEGRRKEFDQSAYVDWFNGLINYDRAIVKDQRANSIMRKHALNTLNHLKKYIAEIKRREPEWEGI
jgi:hypothetical protein